MKILYEDNEILVVYKEAGLALQTGRTSRKDLVSILKNYLAKDSEGEAYLGIVHRLDQPVEGVVVFAKTPGSAAKLSRAAAEKSRSLLPGAKKNHSKNAAGEERKDPDTEGGMEKLYQAIVCLDSSSYPLAIEGMKSEVTLSDWMGRDTSSNTAYIAAQGEPGAKHAVLSFRTSLIRESKALLEIRLHTGRHHQIRLQMAHAGMPLVGDRKYGACSEGKRCGERSAETNRVPLCLCACYLSFPHPKTGKRMRFHVTPSWLSLISKDANMNDGTQKP